MTRLHLDMSFLLSFGSMQAFGLARPPPPAAQCMFACRSAVTSRNHPAVAAKTTHRDSMQVSASKIDPR